MQQENMAYTDYHDTVEDQSVMPKRGASLQKGEESFGERLAKLRVAAGYSLRELAAELGTSHRMLVYYEKHAGQPAAHLLPKFAKALGVTADQLLGMEPVKSNSKTKDTKLWRRFSLVEKLPPDQRKPIIQVIDSFLEREKLKKAG